MADDARRIAAFFRRCRPRSALSPGLAVELLLVPRCVKFFGLRFRYRFRCRFVGALPAYSPDADIHRPNDVCRYASLDGGESRAR